LIAVGTTRAQVKGKRGQSGQAPSDLKHRLLPPVEELQKLRKLLPTKTGLAQNRPQGTFGNLFVIRNRQAAEWRGWVAQDDVASRLMVQSITNFLQRFTEFLALDNRQFRQKLTSTNSSSIVGGMGSLCFLRLSK
jgi:hypothetical protein